MPFPFKDRRTTGESQFRQITDSARHFAIVSIGLDGVVTYWSPAAELILGWTAGEMIGRPLDRIFTPEDVAAGIPAQERETSLQTGYASDERWHMRKPAERFWATGELTLLRNARGEPVGHAKILYDRTAQKEYETRLQALTDDLTGLLAAKTRERDRLWRNSLDLLLAIDPQGILRALNPAWTTQLGYAPEELQDRHFEPFVHPDDVQATVAAITEAASGPLVNFEVRIRHKAGGFRTIAWTAAPEQGLIYANGRDVTTERAQAAQLAERNQARLRLALEASAMGAWEWDLRSGEVRFLEGAAALHGFPPSEEPLVLPSMDAYIEHVVPDDRPALRAVVRDALDRGVDHRVEYRFRLRDGGIRWLEARGTVHRDPAGMSVVMYGVTTDISRRKHIEQSMSFLAEASAELAALVDPQSTLDKLARLAVPRFADWCAIDLLEDDGRLERVAVAHADPAKVTLAQEFRRRFPRREDASDGSWQIARTGQAMLVPAIDEAMIARAIADPEQRAILHSLALHSYIGVPLVAHARVIGVVTFLTAESQRRYTEEDLGIASELARRAAIAIDNARLYAAVREADREKDVFLATLAHELRNPLAAISNGVALLDMDIADPARRRDLQGMMRRQVGQLSRLVDDLLDVARISTGKIVLRRETVDLGTVIGHAVEATRADIEQAQHRLAVTHSGRAVRVHGDPARLTQVFSNLINNAVRYSPPASAITIDIRAQGDECAVHVRDTGIGIEPDVLPTIFKLFAQGRRPDQFTAHGMGIGLSLVERLVSMHGGRVAARSEGRGKGSEFVVFLPVVPEIHPAAAPAPHAAEGVTWWNGRRILVVDDNADAADALAGILAAFGADVRVVHDGPSALVAAADFSPAAVLLDIGLPGMDGYEVARRLRADDSADILLVAQTGWGQDADRRQAMEAGFDHHWVKPVSIATLRDFVPARRAP